MQLGFCADYNRHAVWLILGEVQCEHGQTTVDQLVHDLNLEHAFGLAPGSNFSGVGQPS